MNQDNEQSEAYRLAAWLNEGAWHTMRLDDVEAAGRELRRQHEEIKTLRAALAAQLIQPKAMTPNEKAVMQQALDALAGVLNDDKDVLKTSISGGLFEVVYCQKAIAALRAAIAQTVQPNAQDAEIIASLRTEIANSKKLLVDVYAMLPEQAIAARQAIDKRTGSWFVWGVDQSNNASLVQLVGYVKV